MQFPQPVPYDVFIDNTRDKFDGTIEYGSGFKSSTGYVWDTGINGVDRLRVVRNAEANSVRIKWH